MTSSAPLRRPAGPPAVQLRPVVEAAGASLSPPGPQRWILEPRTDRVELRTVVRRWATAPGAPARLARVACGTALRAARLAVAVQGRRPLVCRSERSGVLAVVHAGDPAEPGQAELLLHALLQRGPAPVPGRARTVGQSAALQRLRQAAEVEGAWLRALPTGSFAAVPQGPRWQYPDGPDPAPTAPVLLAVVGAPGRTPAADLRLGQALQMVGLTAAALGLDLQVLAAPVAPTAPGARRLGGPGTDTLAVVQACRPGGGDPTTSNDEPPLRRQT